MIRVFQIAILCCVSLLFTGCNGSKESKPIWQQMKINDIAPSYKSKHDGVKRLKTINFSVNIFEIPAENINAMDDVWRHLYTKTLQFNNYNAFNSNLFVAGIGQIQMWDKIRNLLLAADSRRVKIISLLIPAGQTQNIPIAELNNERTIFYTSTADLIEGATIGPGELNLRIKAEKIPGSRGVCKVSVLPVFSSPSGKKRDDFSFTCCRFGLKMSPGNFVLLGPKKYSTSEITLGSLFFSRPGRRPVVRTYLIICTRINQ